METIEYGFCDTPFGEIVAVKTPRGIRGVQFAHERRMRTLHEMTAGMGTDVTFWQNDDMAGEVWNAFAEGQEQRLALDVSGTPFQMQVWETLRQVHTGTTVSYSELARIMGMPRAVRAVASAVARNPVALIIPCHRVIHQDGTTGEYHWGSHRKQALIEWERNGRYTSHAGGR